MSGWAAKRFWSEATVEAVANGFAVALDGRNVKTPAKTPLVVPTLGLAQAIADEWLAQDGVVRPETMPFTRMANSALDKVAPQFVEVADMIAAYGASDLLCYRAEHPQALAQRQNNGWSPVLDWAARVLDAPLVVTAGIVHVEQPPASVTRLRALVYELSHFQLAAFHDLVAVSGSLLLGLAVIRGQIEPDTAWTLSQVDESWQAEQWGADDEAAESERFRREGFIHAARFFALCG